MNSHFKKHNELPTSTEINNIMSIYEIQISTINTPEPSTSTINISEPSTSKNIYNEQVLKTNQNQEGSKPGSVNEVEEIVRNFMKNNLANSLKLYCDESLPRTKCLEILKTVHKEYNKLLLDIRNTFELHSSKFDHLLDLMDELSNPSEYLFLKHLKELGCYIPVTEYIIHTKKIKY